MASETVLASAFAQPGSAQPGSAQPGSAQPGSAEPESAEPGSGRRSLHALTLAIDHPDRTISDELDRVPLSALRCGLGLHPVESLRQRCVALVTDRQLPSVLALIALDGIARRILLCTPDLAPHLPAIVKIAQVDVVLTDQPDITFGVPAIDAKQVLGDFDHPPDLGPSLAVDQALDQEVDRTVDTEWVLFTSGTTAMPKMVVHTLSSLTGPLTDGPLRGEGAIPVWSTFYDIRRYGGLQILLRALVGGGSMVLSSPQESIQALLTRLAQAGVSHISGTPSHWRKVLMSPTPTLIAPFYVRLSGEIADQTLLDALIRTYPAANVAHAFATTEAGVGFDVRDGRAGFPIALTEPATATAGSSTEDHPAEDSPAEDSPVGRTTIRVINGSLHLRSPRIAKGYLSHPKALIAIANAEGFVDTGDLVVRQDDRYVFKGRREGIINVGGQKVWPEEVEAVLAQYPAVRIARVHPRPNPITGSVVTADVVLVDPAAKLDDIKADLLRHCRNRLTAWKVPVLIQQVATIELNAAGKLARGP